MVTPKPYQYPHPPVWMATSSEESARIAGENGLGLLCFSILQPLSKLGGVIASYAQAQQRAKPLTRVHTNKVGIYTLVHCAKSRTRFRAEPAVGFDVVVVHDRGSFRAQVGTLALSPEAQAKAFPLLKKQADGDFDITQFDKEDMVIVGTPDECLEKFLKYEDAGVHQVLCYLNFGYLPHEAVLESIRLLGDHVIPELKKAGAARMASALEKSVSAHMPK